MSFDFKERNVSFSEFPVGKLNTVRYPSRDSIFRNILIAFNGKKKSSSVLAIRTSHFKIELQRPNGAKKSVKMFLFTIRARLGTTIGSGLTEGSWFFTKKPALSIRETEPSVMSLIEP